MGRKRKRVSDDVTSMTLSVTSSVGCGEQTAAADVKTAPGTNSPGRDPALDGPAPRNAANERERARMRVLSRAFTRLKTSLPWVPADTKLSKLDTLRLASCYIAHLSRLLAEDDDIKAGGTAAGADDVHSSTAAVAATTSTPNVHPLSLVSSPLLIVTCALYSASQPPPLNFSDIFPKRLGIFNPNFTRLLYVPVHAAGTAIFLFNYLQL